MLVNGFFEEYLDIFYINSSALNAGNYRGVVNIQKLVFRPIVYVSQSEEKVMLSVSIFIGKMAKIVNSELRKRIDVTAREKTIKQLKYGYNGNFTNILPPLSLFTFHSFHFLPSTSFTFCLPLFSGLVKRF